MLRMTNETGWRY